MSETPTVPTTRENTGYASVYAVCGNCGREDQEEFYGSEAEDVELPYGWVAVTCRLFCDECWEAEERELDGGAA